MLRHRNHPRALHNDEDDASPGTIFIRQSSEVEDSGEGVKRESPKSCKNLPELEIEDRLGGICCWGTKIDQSCAALSQWGTLLFAAFNVRG